MASLKNLGINLVLAILGFVIALLLVSFLRGIIRRLNFPKFPHAYSVVNAANLVLISILVDALDLWKKPTLLGLNLYAAIGYLVAGFLITLSICSEALVGLSKDLTADLIGDLQRRLDVCLGELSTAVNLEALVREVMGAKLHRLSERRLTGNGTLEEALAPAKQVHVLLQVLHGHFHKQLPPGPEHRLRIGIYMLSTDGKVLEATYSWDGKKTGCFSNKHKDFMKLANPGGGRSVVVESWNSSESPFQFVANGPKAQQSGKFRYFYAGQEKDLQSMVAFRHNLTGLSPDDALVLTMDSNMPDFFSGKVESECRMLLPAFCRRIELELLAHS